AAASQLEVALTQSDRRPIAETRNGSEEQENLVARRVSRHAGDQADVLVTVLGRPRGLETELAKGQILRGGTLDRFGDLHLDLRIGEPVPVDPFANRFDGTLDDVSRLPREIRQVERLQAHGV